MKRVVATTVILLAGAASALAQTSPSQPATPATPQASPAAPSSDTLKNTDVPKTPAAPSMPPSSVDKSGLGGPTAGANSFTENQAKTRLESSGFSNVSGLKKDDNGVWRATAQKDGKSQSVSLDYQGNITTQ